MRRSVPIRAANPAFAAATRRFHAALRHKGCALKVVVLPEAGGAGKVGLDDYLVAHGVADFHAFVRRRGPAGDRQLRVDQLIDGWLPALRRPRHPPAHPPNHRSLWLARRLLLHRGRRSPPGRRLGPPSPLAGMYTGPVWWFYLFWVTCRTALF